MSAPFFQIEPMTAFDQSIIWTLNQDYYKNQGVSAWTDQVVPFHITSNAVVAKAYAKMILSFLRDLAGQGQCAESVYILELGAGHGKLGYQILHLLDKLMTQERQDLPGYCYILSDISEDTLAFYDQHAQLQEYFDRGVLDIAFFDGAQDSSITLRRSKETIGPHSLTQPIFTIANYFFDTLPNELFYINNKQVSQCLVSIRSDVNPEGLEAQELIKNMQLKYELRDLDYPHFDDEIDNMILSQYQDLNKSSYIFYPNKGLQCLRHLRALSQGGLVLLAMDKGYHTLDGLTGRGLPELITHGSFSCWVNFHALAESCIHRGGRALFPSKSHFSVKLACLIYAHEGEEYYDLAKSYHDIVDSFGPDDFNQVKNLAYANVSRLQLKELISMYRLSAHDASMFIRFLPRLKQLMKSISMQDRLKIREVVHLVWGNYFYINEDMDLSYELGGLLYDLAFYDEALTYFNISNNSRGAKEDVLYNQALCYYQLRKDDLFYEVVKEGKAIFPESLMLKNLEELDMR